MNNKKPWQKPGLVILVRNKAEEAVLTTCKNTSFTGGPPDHYYGCYVWDPRGCQDCETHFSS